MTIKGVSFSLVISLLMSVSIAVGEDKPVEIKDSVTGMEFVSIKGKCFQMGNIYGDGSEEEKPVHEICLGDFILGKHEVTQEQWVKIMGTNPSKNIKCGERCPVENVNWNEVQEFLSKLNKKSNKSKYRLPTEAEWEFAARSGGKPDLYSGGETLKDIAWYFDYDGEPDYNWSTKKVATKKPNSLGLYDMSGNVWEWTGDYYDKDYYLKSPKNSPSGPISGEYRVLRGGSWRNGPNDVRTTYRNYLPADYRSDIIGLRLVMVNKDQ